MHYYDETLKSREETAMYAAPLTTEDGRTALYKFLKETMDPSPMRLFQEKLNAGGFPVPLLLLYAERDPMVPARFGDLYRAALPDAQFETVKNASHFMHVDAVERFMPPTLAFLKGLAP